MKTKAKSFEPNYCYDNAKQLTPQKQYLARRPKVVPKLELSPQKIYFRIPDNFDKSLSSNFPGPIFLHYVNLQI